MNYLSHLVEQLAVPTVTVQARSDKESLFTGVPEVVFPRILSKPPAPVDPVVQQPEEKKEEEPKRPEPEKPVVIPPAVIIPPVARPKPRPRPRSRKARRSPPPPPPTEPLQLPCRVYIQRTAESMPPNTPEKDRRVYGLFLYADDLTGTGKRFTYQGVRANSVFLFEFPDLEDPDKLVYFARPAAAESYIRGTDTGKGWPSIFVDPCEEKDRKPQTMAEFLAVDTRCRTLASYVGANKPGFCNDPEFDVKMRDELCQKARERYERKSRVSVLSELLQREKDKANGIRKPARKRARTVASVPAPTPVPPNVAPVQPTPVQSVAPAPVEPLYPRSVVSQVFRPFAPQFLDAFMHCLDVAMGQPSALVFVPLIQTPAGLTTVDDDPFGLRDIPACPEPQKDLFDSNDVFD